MISAISLKGIVASINLFGSIDGLTFEAFVIRKLIPKLWKGAVVVWDNYSQTNLEKPTCVLENSEPNSSEL